MISLSSILKLNGYILFSLLFILINEYYPDNINYILFFDFLLLILNLFYSFNFIKDILYVIFNLMIFLFLLSRPLIEFLYGIDYWDVNLNSYSKALFIIGLSLISLHLGYILFNNRGKIFSKDILKLSKEAENILFLVFVFLSIVNFIVNVDRYLLLKDMAYTDNYLAFQGRVPSVFVSLSSIYVYFFIFILAAIPTKLKKIISIIFYFIGLIPLLLIGERNGLGQFFIFVILYLLFQKDLKIDLKRILYISCLLFLTVSLFNYIGDSREDKSYDRENSYGSNGIINFLYLQGTSFYTIVQGIENEENLPNKKDKFYSFGMAIDYLIHNSISSKIINVPDIGSGNNMNAVLNSNNLAHPLSYLVMGDSYLAGHGRGTSYILENYIDFGYNGVVIFSFILGGVISVLNDALRFKSYYIRILCLLTILNIILLPRVSYSSFFYYFFDFKFLFLIMVVFTLDKFFYFFRVSKR